MKKLLVPVLLASLPCGAWAVRLNRKRAEQRWIAEIEQLRGSVWYDWQRGIRQRPEPEWLQHLVGGDFFARPVLVDLSNLAILSEAEIIKQQIPPSVIELWRIDRRRVETVGPIRPPRGAPATFDAAGALRAGSPGRHGEAAYVGAGRMGRERRGAGI